LSNSIFLSTSETAAFSRRKVRPCADPISQHLPVSLSNVDLSGVRLLSVRLLSVQERLRTTTGDVHPGWIKAISILLNILLKGMERRGQHEGEGQSTFTRSLPVTTSPPSTSSPP